MATQTHQIKIDMQANTQALQRLEAEMGKFQTQLNGISQGAGRFNAAARSMAQAMQQFANGTQQFRVNQQQVASAQQALTAALSSGRSSIQQNRQALLQYSQALVQAGVTVENATKSMNNMKNAAGVNVGALNNMGRAANATGQNMNSMSNQLVRTVTHITAALVVYRGVVESFSASVFATTQFEDNMRSMNTIAQLSEGAFQDLRGTVLEAAGNMEYGAKSASQLSESLFQITSSGFEGANALDVLSVSSRGAVAGVTEVATASQLLLQILNAYGKPASDAERVMDVLFQTVNFGIVTFEQLAQYMTTVISTAAALGVSIEDVGAAIAAMTREGQAPDQAFTSLNQVLTSLLDPAVQSKKVFDELGIATGQAAFAGRDFVEVMSDIYIKTQGNAEVQAQLFGNIRALRGVFALVNDEGKQFAELQGEMTQSAGAMSRAFEQQTKSVGFQFRQMFAEIQALLISELGPAFEQLVPMAQEMANALVPIAASLIRLFVDLGPTIANALEGIAVVVNQVTSTFESMPPVLAVVAAGLLLFSGRIVGLMANLAGLPARIMATAMAFKTLGASTATSNAYTGAATVTAASRLAGLAGPIGMAVTAVTGLGLALDAVLSMTTGKGIFERIFGGDNGTSQVEAQTKAVQELIREIRTLQNLQGMEAGDSGSQLIKGNISELVKAIEDYNAARTAYDATFNASRDFTEDNSAIADNYEAAEQALEAIIGNIDDVDDAASKASEHIAKLFEAIGKEIEGGEGSAADKLVEISELINSVAGTEFEDEAFAGLKDLIDILSTAAPGPLAELLLSGQDVNKLSAEAMLGALGPALLDIGGASYVAAGGMDEAAEAAGGLSGTLKDVLDSLNPLIDQFGAFEKDLLDVQIIQAERSVEDLEQALDDLVASYEDAGLTAEQIELLPDVQAATQALEDAERALEGLTDRRDDIMSVREEMAELFELMLKFPESFGLAGSEAEALAKAMGGLADNIPNAEDVQGLFDFFIGLGQKGPGVAEAIGKVADQLGGMLSLNGATGDFGLDLGEGFKIDFSADVVDATKDVDGMVQYMLSVPGGPNGEPIQVRFNVPTEEVAKDIAYIQTLIDTMHGAELAINIIQTGLGISPGGGMIPDGFELPPGTTYGSGQGVTRGGGAKGGLAAASRMVSDMTPVIEALNAGFASVSAAVNGLAPAQQTFIQNIDDLASMSAEVVTVFQNYASQFGAEGIESAQKFAQAADSIYGMVQAALDATALLAESQIVSPDLNKIDDLAEVSAKFVEIFGHWASFFVTLNEEGENMNPLMENAAAFASSAGSVFGVIQDAIDGSNALAAQEFRMPNIEQINEFASMIGDFVEAFGAQVTEPMTPAALATIGLFADTGGSIAGMIGDAVDAFNAIADFSPPNPQDVWNVLTAVRDTVQYAMIMLGTLFDNEIDVYTEGNMGALSVFAGGADSIVGVIGNAIEAFKGIAKFKPPSAQDVWNVLSAVKMTVDYTLLALGELFESDALDIYSEGNMAALESFASGAGAVVGLISNTIGAFEGIAKFRIPRPGEMENVLDAANDATQIVIDFLYSDEIAAFSQAQLELAETWSNTAGGIVGLISTAVENFADLGKFKAPDSGQLQSFANEVHNFVEIVVDLVSGNSGPFSRGEGKLTNAVLEKAELWASTASAIVGIISEAVDAFKSLKSFNAPDESDIDDFIQFLDMLVDKVAEAAKGTEGLNAAANFSGVGEAIFSMLGGMDEAMAGFKNFRAPSEDSIDNFIGFIKKLVQKMGDAARDPAIKEVRAAAQRLAVTVQEVMAAINDSFTAFENINDFKGVDGIGAFVESIKQVIIRMAAELGDISNDLLDEAEDAKEAINQAIGDFASAVESINSLNDLRRPNADEISDFVESVVEVIEALGDTSFDKDVVTAARKFNQVIGKAMSNINSAVDALGGLLEFKAPPTANVDAFIASIIDFIDRLVQGLRTSLIQGMDEAEKEILATANELMGLISAAAQAMSAAAEAAILNVDMDAFMGKVVGAVNDVAAHAGDQMDIDVAIEVLEELKPFFTALNELGLATASTGGGGGGGEGGGGKGGGGGRDAAQDNGEAERKQKESFDHLFDGMASSFENLMVPMEDLLAMTRDIGSHAFGLPTATKFLELWEGRLDSINSAISDAEQELADLFSGSYETQIASTAVSVVEALLAQMRLNAQGIVGETPGSITDLADSLRSLFDVSRETAQMSRIKTVMSGFLTAAMQPIMDAFEEGGNQIETIDQVLTGAGLENAFGNMGDDMARFVDRILRKNGIIGAGESVVGQSTLTLQGWMEELDAALKVSQAIDAALDAFAEGMTAEEKHRSRLIQRWDRMFAEWKVVGDIAGDIEGALEGLDPNTQLSQAIFQQAFGSMWADAAEVLNSALAAAGMGDVDVMDLTAGQLMDVLDDLGNFADDNAAIDEALKALVAFQESDASRTDQMAKIEELRQTIIDLESERIAVLEQIKEATKAAADYLNPANQPAGGGGSGGGGGVIVPPDYNSMTLAQIAQAVGNIDVDNLTSEPLQEEVLERFDTIWPLLSRAMSQGSIAIDIANGMPRLGAIQKWWGDQGYPANLLDDFIDYKNLAAGGIVKASHGGTIVRVAEAGFDEAVVPLKAGMNFGGGGMSGDINITVYEAHDAQQTAQEVRRQISEVLFEADSELRVMAK